MIEFSEQIRKIEELPFWDVESDMPMGKITRVNNNAFVVEFDDWSSCEVWFHESFTWDQVKDMILNQTWKVNHTDGINPWVIPE